MVPAGTGTPIRQHAEEFLGVFMTQYLGAVLPLNEELRAAAYQMID